MDYSEAIVDTVRVPLVVLNNKLQVLTANRAFYDAFQLKPKDTENKSIYKLNHKAWAIPKFKILLEEILPFNTYLDNYELDIEFPNFGKRIMLLNARRTYRQVNNTEAILLAFEDITDRKQLEKQKDDFIGIVSHELKTPLTGIKAFSQLLEKHLIQHEDTKGTYLLSKMISQMERLTQLMASFANVYKIQNGKLELVKKEFDINALIENIVSDFSYTTKTHHIQFQSLPTILIKADKERISQVLINLISNAIKYSPENDKIILRLSKEKNTVTISIQDFGLGIPKEEQSKIFDRFFRVKRKTTHKISGLGLGLYISYEIIMQHKGTIKVESDIGKGSIFYITLPIK